MQKFLFYLPRSLAVIIAVYVAALNPGGYSAVFGWQDSLTHWVMAVLLLGMALIAWNWPLIGGLIYFLFGLKYFLLIFTPENLPVNLLSSGLFCVAGILFMWEGYRNIRRNTQIGGR